MKKWYNVFVVLLVIAAMMAGCTLPPPPQVAPAASATIAPTAVPMPSETSTETPSAEEAVPTIAETTIAGRWQGNLSVATLELEIVVTFSTDGEELSGTIDIPQQNATGLPLHDITYEFPNIHFEMLSGPQLAVFEGTLGEEGAISGQFMQAGAEGTFALEKVAEIVAEPAPEETTPTPAAEAERTYTSPDGLFSVPIPTNWTVEKGDNYAAIKAPEGELVAYVLALPAEDVADAIKAAWEIVDPTFDLEIDETIEAPASADIEKTLIVNYKSEDEERFAQAVGQLYQGMVYVQLYRGDLLTVQKRAAQAQIIATGFKITGREQEDLSGVAPLPLTDAILAELESYIVDTMERFQIPGAAVAIVQDGEIVYAKGFGTRGPDSDEPITPDTQMMIGSTGKTMTTMLMATLVDDGRMAWDTPVVEILPDFAVADPEITQKLTVRNLVCACTGVPRRDFEWLFNADQLSAEDVIESLATFQFFTDFGEAFQYSNQMVATGGYAAAAAAGGEYGDLYAAYNQALQARILDPIGMENTTLSFDEVVARDNYAVPHGQNLGFEYNPIPLSIEQLLVPLAPAGAHWSTVQDMGRYLITELNKGVAPDGTRVVSSENLAVTWEPQVAITADASYGLGWIVDEYKGLQMLHHGGNTFGFTSDLAFLPEADLGISVLANGRVTNLFNEAVRFRLLELAFDQELEADTSVTFAYERMAETYAELADRIGDTIDTEAVAPYLGHYNNEVLGEIDVSLEDGRLLMDSGEFVSELRPSIGEDAKEGGYLIYNAPLAGTGVTLEENEAGTPIIVLGGGVAEYTFEKVE